MGLNVRVKILILGGTREGRDLAELLVAGGHDVITSLAGRVRHPARIAGEVRVGGFGGTDGLADWLVGSGTDRVVDATHPFAERISANAVAACRRTRTPLLRIARPSWESHPLAANWTWVDSHNEAAVEAARHEKVLLTVGRQSLDHYRALPGVVARMVELPEEPLPNSWQPLLERGPFTVDAEKDLLRRLGADVLVTKDSGGSLTEAKMTAAADLGVRVIVIRRAPVPQDVPQVVTPPEALAWLTTSQQ
jgi:precorrin-6A reductase